VRTGTALIVATDLRKGGMDTANAKTKRGKPASAIQATACDLQQFLKEPPENTGPAQCHGTGARLGSQEDREMMAESC